MIRKAAFFSCLLVAPLAAAPENLLRNGSFEGGLLYWHLEKANQTLEKGDAVIGGHSLKISKGYVMSAPFVATRDEDFTLSFSVKALGPNGRVGVQMPPSAREVGIKAGRLWTAKAGFSEDVGTEWKRVSFTWKADVPPDGFWPNPHYMVLIGNGDGVRPAILVDGVTVTRGKGKVEEYLPRRAVEVVADCVNLPGFAGAAGNAFDVGQTAEMVAHVSNPGKEGKSVTLAWQLIDYEGVTPVSKAVTKTIQLSAGQTISEPLSIPLTHKGMVLGRATVSDADGVIDQSDFPLTTMPYPKKATKPDFRERFGGSFAAKNGDGRNALAKFQRIGFGWLRWQPHANGRDHLPKEPADKSDASTWDWTWMDKILDEQESFGQSSHIVLYPPPRWIMEGDHGSHPLPLDMRWKADDPRWDDLGIETVWDKFVKGAVARYKDKSVIFEIENEPEFDRWIENKLGEEYAKFTIRTAKQIRKLAPEAKIMVDNVYGIPSQINSYFFKAGGLKHIDVMSWHDYHAGWLTDATGIKRMRQNMDEAGGKNVEIWFNEGWAFTNTAVDEPIACTNLTAAESTNAQMASVAEMTVAGQEKTVLFHVTYETHGQSFWDYSGPGTMLWDWYGFPLPLVASWNVMAHHIGISDEVGFVRPPGANFTIFQDQRNGRGVMIAYADRGAKEDVTVELPDMGAPMISEDVMGNAVPAPKRLTLSKTGRPVILYTAAKTPGKAFLDRLESLDRKNQGFVSAGGGAAPEYKLPAVWEGSEKGSSEGSVAMADGKPVWKLEQLWPADFSKPGNFKPMVWTGTGWHVKEGGMGGQPGTSMRDGVLVLGTRAQHGPENDRHLRTAGLTFVAPSDGVYSLRGKVSCKMWDGKNSTKLNLLKKTASSVEKVDVINIANGAEAPLDGKRVSLGAGEELVLVPQIEGMFTGGDCRFSEFSISLGDGDAPATAVGYRLPAVWEGSEKGSSTGNPVSANGKPVWRLDRLYPADAIMASNYSPMVWGNNVWIAPDRSQGGHPSAGVSDGKVSFGAMGPWGGNEFNYPKIPVLAFIAPKSGVYKVTGNASSKPWDGSAKTFPLAIRKKDTQRAAEVSVIQLPRDGSGVPFSVEVELTEGHELLFVPMMHGLHNNATNLTIRDLVIIAP